MCQKANKQFVRNIFEQNCSNHYTTSIISFKCNTRKVMYFLCSTKLSPFYYSTLTTYASKALFFCKYFLYLFLHLHMRRRRRTRFYYFTYVWPIFSSRQGFWMWSWDFRHSCVHLSLGNYPNPIIKVQSSHFGVSKCHQSSWKLSTSTC